MTRAPIRVVHASKLAGAVLAQGVRVARLFGSANRDERRFHDPDRFDIGRNPVITLVRAGRRCVGTYPALEAIEALLDRLDAPSTDPSYRLRS